MQLTFGPYRLDVDIERTRTWYTTAPTMVQQCGCIDCRNYDLAMMNPPPEWRTFFDHLGIDPRRPAEVYLNEVFPHGEAYYSGWFHLCGQLLQGESPWTELPESIARRQSDPGASATFFYDESKAFSAAKNLSVSFQENCALVGEGFPEPVIQMEFSAYLPWLMDKPN